MAEHEAMLAGRAGRYREWAPAVELAAHFRCAWSHEVAPDHVGPMVVVPDGCIDIVWLGGRLHVAGPDVEAALPKPPAGATIMGMRFQPGAAALWLRAPIADLVGRQVPLDAFWGAVADRLAGRIGSAATAAERLVAFEAGLVAGASGRPAPDGDIGFLFDRLTQGGASLDTLGESLDLSPRTLRRRSIDAFGYGPKTLERILRFQRFLALGRAGAATGLAALADAAGYADQAHLSREVRRLAGLSPAAVRAQLLG